MEYFNIKYKPSKLIMDFQSEKFEIILINAN